MQRGTVVRGLFGTQTIEPTPIMKVREDVFEVARTKKDVVVPARDLMMSSNTGNIHRRTFSDREGLVMTDWAQGQLFSKLGMPSLYMKKMLPEQPHLVADHANFHLGNLKDEDWFVRTYGGQQARAFLSSRYSVCDNSFIVDTLSQFIQNDHNIKHYSHDDRTFHLRMAFPDLSVKIGKLNNGDDDIVQCGIHLINSEVGASSLRVEAVLWRQVCTNGLVVRVGGEVALQQRHVFLRDHEIQGRLRDAVSRCIEGGFKSVESFHATKETHVVEPLTIIDKLASQQKYSEQFKDNIKTEYAIEKARSGDTQFTLINAFTAAAKQLKPDGRVEVEKFAGTLLDKNLNKLVELTA